MGQSALEWGRATKRVLSDVTIAPDQLVSWSRISSHVDRIDFARALQVGDWSGLAGAATAAESRESKVVAQMSAAQRRLVRQMEVLLGPPSEVHEGLRGLQDRADWPDIRQAALDELAKRGGDQDAIAWLAGRLDAGLDPVGSMVAPLKYVAGQLDDLATIHLRVWAGGTLARLVAGFNAAAAPEGPQGIDPHDACRASEAEVQHAITQLWQACAQRKPRSVARAAKSLAALGDAGNQTLQNLLRSAGEQAGRPSSGTQVGVQIRLGDCLRATLTAASIGRWVAWTLLRSDPYMGRNRVFGRAEDLLAFPAANEPAVLDPGMVARAPAQYDGQVVTIQGVVSGAVAGSGDVSTASVAGATGSMTLCAEFVRLEEAGLAEGVCVRATGTVQVQGGNAVLVVGYHDIEAASKTSFYGWLCNETTDVFRAVPHDLALSVSWKPGFDGAGNQLRYGIWFS